MTPPQRVPFDWLADRKHRRSALRDIETAVRRGWLDHRGADHQARRDALVAALTRLILDPSSRPREMLRAAKIIAVASGGAIDPARWRTNRPTRLDPTTPSPSPPPGLRGGRRQRRLAALWLILGGLGRGPDGS